MGLSPGHYLALFFSGMWDAGITYYFMVFRGFPEGNPLARVWIEAMGGAWSLFWGKAFAISLVLAMDIYVERVDGNEFLYRVYGYGIYGMALLWFLAGSSWLLFY